MYKCQETKKIMSSDERIDKPIFMYKMEYYSAIKKKNLLIHTTTWMDRKDITLSERSWSQKVT